jgi:hypothetical protein
MTNLNPHDLLLVFLGPERDEGDVLSKPSFGASSNLVQKVIFSWGTICSSLGLESVCYNF